MPNKTDIFADDWGSKDELITRMKEQTGALETTQIEEAFQAIDRRDFLKDGYRVEAYEDYAIPIVGEQTNSQPTTVAHMLELLAASGGETVLDVGAGSGWTTALLAEIVGRAGRVIGMEVREEVAEFGRKNLEKYDLPQAELRVGNPLKEQLPEAPFARILVSAAGEGVPDALVAQLAIGGTMVLPVEDKLVKLTKKSESKIETEELPGFTFVPLKT